MIKVNGIEIKQGRFPDGTLLMKFDPTADKYENIGNNASILVEWLYENDGELFSLICVKKQIDRYFNKRSTVLEMPYIPHARMDRVKSNEDVFTLKYFCEVINSLKFDVVLVRDAHSSVSLALLDNVIDGGVIRYVREAIKTVINMFAQQYYGYDGKRYTSYDGFWSCLGKIREQVPHGSKIGFPDHIGCGLGGANWEVIKTMIWEALSEDFEVYIYKLEA